VSLTSEQITAMIYVEQQYYSTKGQIPTFEAIAAATGFPVAKIARWFQDDEWHRIAAQRGMDLRPPEQAGVLTPEQLTLANMLVNVSDRRSVREKLKEAEVKPATYTGWLQQPAFQGYLRARAEELFKASDATAYLAHIKAIEGGDMKAVELFYEMRGIHTRIRATDNKVSNEVIIRRVVEVVARHVTDDQMDAILTDLENMLTGGSPHDLSPPDPTPVGGGELIELT
jgi:hypothetical protein